MPFHEFNSILGRLTESPKLQPLYPIRPVPLNKVEAPKPMFDSIKTQAMQSSVVRMASGSSHASRDSSGILMKGQESLPENLKKNYIKYQSNIDEMVYLKGGRKDRILFGITLALTAFCLGDTFYHMWKYRNYK